MCRWCKTLDDAKRIATEWRKNWGTAHWSSKLTKPSTLNQNWSNDICFSRSVRNLGVIFDDKLCMKQQVSKICQSAYLELRRISSIKHVLTVDATKTLVTSLVLSHLDYCSSLLSGIPQQLIDKLQRFKIVLLDSFLKRSYAQTFHHFWLNCSGFK